MDFPRCFRTDSSTFSLERTPCRAGLGKSSVDIRRRMKTSGFLGWRRRWRARSCSPSWQGRDLRRLRCAPRTRWHWFWSRRGQAALVFTQPSRAHRLWSILVLWVRSIYLIAHLWYSSPSCSLSSQPCARLGWFLRLPISPFLPL